MILERIIGENDLFPISYLWSELKSKYVTLKLFDIFPIVSTSIFIGNHFILAARFFYRPRSI